MTTTPEPREILPADYRLRAAELVVARHRDVFKLTVDEFAPGFLAQQIIGDAAPSPALAIRAQAASVRLASPPTSPCSNQLASGEATA